MYNLMLEAGKLIRMNNIIIMKFPKFNCGYQFDLVHFHSNPNHQYLLKVTTF